MAMMAMMDLHLVVGGLMARNPALSRLLLNYADLLDNRYAGQATTMASCFIVPAWTVDQSPSAPPSSELLVVEAHMHRDDPSRRRGLDATLHLLHSVLTDAEASGAIIIHCLGMSAEIMAGDLETVFKVAIWEIAPAPSPYPTVTQPRLAPWPCPSQTATTGFSGRGIEAINMN
jgi:hypothetical protein